MRCGSISASSILFPEFVELLLLGAVLELPVVGGEVVSRNGYVEGAVHEEGDVVRGAEVDLSDCIVYGMSIYAINM